MTAPTNFIQAWDLICQIADLYGDPDPNMDALNRDTEIHDLLINLGVLHGCNYCDLSHRDPEMCPEYPTQAQRLAEMLYNGNVTVVGQHLRQPIAGQHELLIDAMVAYAEMTNYPMAEVARRFKVAWNAASD